jgi:hypothetical protein
VRPRFPCGARLQQQRPALQPPRHTTERRQSRVASCTAPSATPNRGEASCRCSRRLQPPGREPRPRRIPSPPPRRRRASPAMARHSDDSEAPAPRRRLKTPARTTESLARRTTVQPQLPRGARLQQQRRALQPSRHATERRQSRVASRTGPSATPNRGEASCRCSRRFQPPGREQRPRSTPPSRIAPSSRNPRRLAAAAVSSLPRPSLTRRRLDPTALPSLVRRRVPLGRASG